MADNGYPLEVRNVDNLSVIKKQYQVPRTLQSCHTAIVDGYVIEGHVPIAEVNRLLAERPDVVGLAVAGMPVGSPGMEVPGAQTQPFEVVAFDSAGNTQVYARYGP